MNRFTKDMATIDDMLPLVLFDLVQVSLQHQHCFSATQSHFCMVLEEAKCSLPLFCALKRA